MTEDFKRGFIMGQAIKPIIAAKEVYVQSGGSDDDVAQPDKRWVEIIGGRFKVFPQFYNNASTSLSQPYIYPHITTGGFDGNVITLDQSAGNTDADWINCGYFDMSSGYTMEIHYCANSLPTSATTEQDVFCNAQSAGMYLGYEGPSTFRVGQYTKGYTGDDYTYSMGYRGAHFEYVPAAGEWIYICVTFDGTWIKVYFNGELVKELHCANTKAPTNTVWGIGTNPNGTSGICTDYGLNMSLDLFRLYTVGLTETEVQYNYNKFLSMQG